MCGFCQDVKETIPASCFQGVMPTLAEDESILANTATSGAAETDCVASGAGEKAETDCVASGAAEKDREEAPKSCSVSDDCVAKEGALAGEGQLSHCVADERHTFPAEMAKEGKASDDCVAVKDNTEGQRVDCTGAIDVSEETLAMADCVVKAEGSSTNKEQVVKADGSSDSSSSSEESTISTHASKEAQRALNSVS